MLIAIWLWTTLVGGFIDRDIHIGRGESTTMQTAVGERGGAKILEDGTPQPPPKG
jgi:hypothetical protein